MFLKKNSPPLLYLSWKLTQNLNFFVRTIFFSSKKDFQIDTLKFKCQKVFWKERPFLCSTCRWQDDLQSSYVAMAYVHYARILLRFSQIEFVNGIGDLPKSCRSSSIPLTAAASVSGGGGRVIWGPYSTTDLYRHGKRKWNTKEFY